MNSVLCWDSAIPICYLLELAKARMENATIENGEGPQMRGTERIVMHFSRAGKYDSTNERIKCLPINYV